MKYPIKNILFFSLTSLATLASANDPMMIPSMQGGLIASVGTFYAIPSADNQDYVSTVNIIKDSSSGIATQTLNPVNNDGEFGFGFDVSLGYIFENTANGIELSYRGLNTSSKDSAQGDLYLSEDTVSTAEPISADNKLAYEYNDADALFTQYFNVGRRMQARLAAGVAYLDLEQEQKTNYKTLSENPFVAASTPARSVNKKNNSHYQGLGPRFGLDGRYLLGKGFGFLGGVSAAFFLGDLEMKTTFSSVDITTGNPLSATQKNDIDFHSVLNLSGKIGLDYVYVMQNPRRTNLGVELGYRVDYYDDAVGDIAEVAVNAPRPDRDIARKSESQLDVYFVDTYDAAFSGLYLDIKAAF